MSLIAKNIYKSLGTPSVDILKGVQFEINDGEFVALKGRSGSGKSTLLYVLSSLDDPSKGDVIVNDVNVRDLSYEQLHKFRNEQIGFVFQFHYLLPELTALENVLMPARKCQKEIEKEKYAYKLFEMFDLNGKHHKLPRHLSGGENQRVAIARSLIMNPKFLFADEPTGSLDSVNSDRVFQILNQINKEFGTTIVMVTHDDELSLRTKRIIELKDGVVVSDRALA